MSALALLPIVGDTVRTLLDRLLPDDKARAAAELELRRLEREPTYAQQAEQALALAQISVNKAEAESQSLFKGGWRPGAGWVCVAGLGVQFIAAPLLPWVVLVATGKTLPPIPALDIETLLVLLGGLLGLGGLRHREKVKGVAS